MLCRTEKKLRFVEIREIASARNVIEKGLLLQVAGPAGGRGAPLQ